MCGIVAYLGDHDAWPIIVEGLKRLEYRGYDSAGIAIVDQAGRLHLRKTVGKVVGLEEPSTGKPPPGFLGLGHTRWATHGRPSHANAHPHVDCQGQVVLVHNGIVENYQQLRSRLAAAGHVFRSETDTEVLTHLLEEGLEQGLAFEEAFRRMGRMIKGPQAIAATTQDGSGPICALRLGFAGGIVVAEHEGQAIISSDLPALLPVLEAGADAGPAGDPAPGGIGFLETGEMAVVDRTGVRYQDLEGNDIDKQPRSVSREDVLMDKGGYPHFMLKEIMEQPQAMIAAMRGRADFETGQVRLPEVPLTGPAIQSLERVVLIGCGTSLHAAQVGRNLVERLAGIPAEAESASEFRYRDPIIGPRTLVVAIGQSGETADTVAAMHLAKSRGATLLTVCNREDSQAARIADGVLYMRAGLEVGVASTKTFIASLTILELLAMYLGQERGFQTADAMSRLVQGLAECPRLIGELLADTGVHQYLAREYYDYENFLYLGRGYTTPIASEGALKLKEISYIHAEGYPAGEMKHGPIALIEPGLCTVALAPRDSLYDKVANNIREVKARDGAVLAVLTRGDASLAAEVDGAVFIPDAADHLVPILATIPLQLLSYHIALLRDCDVDQPRNLAKSVTVE